MISKEALAAWIRAGRPYTPRIWATLIWERQQRERDDLEQRVLRLRTVLAAVDWSEVPRNQQTGAGTDGCSTA